MASLLDKIRGAISGLRNDTQNNLNDNQGLFQRGKFTPIKSAQQSISNFAQQNPHNLIVKWSSQAPSQEIPYMQKTFTIPKIPVVSEYVKYVAAPQAEALQKGVQSYIKIKHPSVYGKPKIEDFGNVMGGLGAINPIEPVVGGGIGAIMKAVENIVNKQPIDKDLYSSYRQGFEFQTKLGPLSKLTSTILKPVLSKLNPSGMQSINTYVNLANNATDKMMRDKFLKLGFDRFIKQVGEKTISGAIGMGTYGALEEAKDWKERAYNIFKNAVLGGVMEGGIRGGGQLLDVGIKQGVEPYISNMIDITKRNPEGGYIKIPEKKMIISSKNIVSELPATTEINMSAQLPSNLAKAKPRYNYGSKAFIPEFANDVDKALYITAQKTPSRLDAEYRSFLKDLGFTDQDINVQGQKVRNYIKQQASISEGGDYSNPAKIKVVSQMQIPNAPKTINMASPQEEILPANKITQNFKNSASKLLGGETPKTNTVNTKNVVFSPEEKQRMLDELNNKNKPLNYTPLNPQDPFYNIERMNISAEGKKRIVDELNTIKPEIEAIVGKPLTDAEVIQTAKTTSDDLIKTIGRQKTEELAASQLRLRQKIAQMAESGTVDQEFIQAIKADKAFGENTARLLQKRSINVDPVSSEGKLKTYLINKILNVVDDEDKILNASKNVDWNNKEQVTEFYRTFVKPTTGEFLDKLRYSSMLSSPNTHLINISSNWQGTGLLTPIQKTIEGTIDSFLTGLSGGKRVRTRFTGEGLAYAKGYYNKQAFTDAYQKLLDTFQNTKMNENPDVRSVSLYTGQGLKQGIEKSFDSVMLALEGMDQFFKTLTSSGLESAYKYRQAKGIKTTNIASKIDKEAEALLFRAPLDQPKEGILTNALGAGGMWIKNATYSKNPLFRIVAKMSFPFINIGTNLAKAGIEANPVLGSVNLINNKDTISAVSKMIMGGVVTLIGTVFAIGDRIHAWEPTDASKRKAQRAAGILPWSITIDTPNGQQSVQFSKLHPLIGFQLGMVAAVYQAWKDNKISEDKVELIMTAMAGTMKYIADQTYFKNLSDFSNLTNGDVTALPSLISNYPSQLVPFRALQGWITRIIDKYQRSPEAGADLLTRVMQNIQSGIPGLSTSVPQRLDDYGQPIENKNRFFNAVSPIKTSPINKKQQGILDLMIARSNQNKIINQRKTQAEQQAKKGLVSTKVVQGKIDKKQTDLTEDIARNQVVIDHDPKAINGKYIYWDEASGTVKTIKPEIDDEEAKKLSPTSQKLLKRSAEYKYIDKIITSRDVDPDYVQSEMKRLNIDMEEATYDIKTGLSDDIQLEEIKNGIADLSGEELLNTLASYRIISEGTRKSLLTDTLIGKLEDEGIIDKNTANTLKNITWDNKTKSFKMASGNTKKTSLAKFTVPSFKSSSSKGVSIKPTKLKIAPLSTSTYAKISAKMPKTTTKTYTPSANKISTKIRKPITRIKNLGSIA
jgi:hypothetical protein